MCLCGKASICLTMCENASIVIVTLAPYAPLSHSHPTPHVHCHCHTRTLRPMSMSQCIAMHRPMSMRQLGLLSLATRLASLEPHFAPPLLHLVSRPLWMAPVGDRLATGQHRHCSLLPLCFRHQARPHSHSPAPHPATGSSSPPSPRALSPLSSFLPPVRAMGVVTDLTEQSPPPTHPQHLL
jgi:hypothetical protein